MKLRVIWLWCQPHTALSVSTPGRHGVNSLDHDDARSHVDRHGGEAEMREEAGFGVVIVFWEMAFEIRGG